MSVFKSYFITMKNVVFGSSGAHTLLRNQISINEAWNTTRNNTVLAKDQLGFNYCCSFKGRSNGRCTKNNKFKCLLFNNYLFFRKIISNQIYNVQNFNTQLAFSQQCILPGIISCASYKFLLSNQLHMGITTLNQNVIA